MRLIKLSWRYLYRSMHILQYPHTWTTLIQAIPRTIIFLKAQDCAETKQEIENNRLHIYI